MKKIIKTTCVLMAAGALFYLYRAPLEDMYTRLTAEYFPCQNPIAYSIGSFDPRFGISKADFLENIASAESVWEKPVQKELFAYAPDGGLKINLIYDYRQEATAKLRALGIAVGDDRASYDALRAKYEAMGGEYEQKKAALETRIIDFKKRQALYEKEVLYWNRRKGAPKEEFDRLNREKFLLDEETAVIQQAQTLLNAEADDINALVSVLNRLVNSLNLNVEKYNAIGKQTGGEFEEGNYQSGPDGQKIDIYQFDDRQKLVRVLAHELGHALGLPHLDDPKAIMYRLNQATNEKLTADDLSALKERCGIR